MSEADRAELRVDASQTPGMPIVCLHAGVCDRRMWAPQVEPPCTSTV